MKHRLVLIGLIILSVALLFLTLSGCGKKSEQSDEGTAPEAEAAKQEPVTPPRQATLPVGTKIAVVTTTTLSTKTNKTGEAFAATLAEDLAEGDWIIARQGALVNGVIANSDPGGRVKGVASITLKLSKLQLADGREVPIATSSYKAVANTTKKKDATKIGVGAGLGAAIGAIAGGGKGAAIGAGIGGAAGTTAALATYGDPAVISSERKIGFTLSAPLEIVEQK